MSKQLSSKKSPVSSPNQHKDIASLQSRLVSSLNAAFDPKENVKSDDDFLEKDYASANLYSSPGGLNEDYQNPYLALAQKAKAYVRQKETEAPKKTTLSSNKSPNVNSAKKGDVFLTGIGLERVQSVEPVEKHDSEEEAGNDDLPDLDYKDVLQGAGHGETDDLEELRRMIKQTRKEMKDYGRELFDLKNVIDEVNDYAGKALGYTADYDHFRTIEHTIQDLGQQNEFKFMKKSNSSVKNLKGPLPAGGGSAAKTSASKESATKTYVKSTTAETLPSRSVRQYGSPGGSTALRNFAVKK